MASNASRDFPGPKVPSEVRRGWTVELICAGLALVAFLNTLPNDFAYDDVFIVRDNPKVNEAGQWLSIWATDYWTDFSEGWPNRDLLYRPVTVTSFRLVRALAGQSAWPQHLVNVFLHALAAVLLVRAARKMGFTAAAAGLAGTIFAVLPIQNEAVASVVGRAEMLVVVGTLAALLCHSRAIESRQRSPRFCWMAAAGAAAFIAMGAKESGVMVVPLVIAWDAMLFFSSRAREQAVFSSAPLPVTADRRPHGRGSDRLGIASLLLRVVYLAVPLLAYLAQRYNAFNGRLLSTARLTKTINVLVDAPVWQHALGAIQLFGMYCVKTFFPWALSVGYSIHTVQLAASPWNLYVAVGLLGLIGLGIAAAWAGWRKHWGVVFAVLALLLSYLPVSNTIVLIQVFFAERLWYFPSVWLSLLLGCALAAAWRWKLVRNLVVILLVACIGRLWMRNGEWRDDGTLYAAAYRDQPEGVQPTYLFGQWLVERGRLDEGIPLLEKAVEMDVGYADAHRALGAAYLRMNNVPQALRHLQIAQMQAPGHRPTERALAEASERLADHSEAQVGTLKRAADSNPADPAAELALIRRLRELGRVPDALIRMEQADQRFAAHGEWQREYAITLVMLNRVDEAIGRYQRAVELRADDVSSRIELAMLLLERARPGDVARADDLTRTATEQSRGEPTVLVARAEVLHALGEVHAAIRTYQQAIDALPEDSEQRRVYEQRVRALGK